MSDREGPNRQVRATALLTIGLAAALVFGIIVLAGGDWIPGTVIVVATVAGLAQQAVAIRRLRGHGIAPR